MALVGIVKYSGTLEEFIWKYPRDDLGTWTQLVVNETQEALLLKDGKICDLFTTGKYILESKNIPILNKIINLPFGGESPFKVEVWFINKRYNLDVKWGTPSPIQLQDAKYKIFIPVRSFGQFGIRIEDSKLFFSKIVGTKTIFTKNEIKLFFRGLYLTKIKDMSYSVKRRKGTVMYVIGTIFMLFTIIAYDEWGIMIFWGILALGFFSYGFFSKEIANRAYRYIDLIEAGYTKLEDISSKMGITEDEVKENINDILNSGMLLGIYYDNNTKEIKEIVSKNNKQKTKEEVKGKKEMRVRVCSGCGATVNSNDDICEFCGTKL